MNYNIRETDKRSASLPPEGESNLLGLLRSMDAENQVLALNFLEGMSVPRNALTDLLAISHFSRHHWLREQARFLFTKAAPRGFVLALQDELNFRNFTPNRHMEWFMRVRRRHGIDSSVLAQYMYNWEMITLPAYMKYGISNAPAFFAPYIQGDKLDLSFTGMDEVPTDLQELDHLRHIDLSGNVLTRLGRIVARLPHLESLIANGNQLRRFNPTIGRMATLKLLDLSSNLLDKLPAGISRLHHLRHLDISRNELEEFPNFLTELTHLEELHISRNQLIKISQDMECMRKLQKLSLDNNPNLEELPESIGSLISLKELNLSRTGVKKLPATFSKLSQLEKLDLSFTDLEDIAPVLKMESLTELNLRGAKINDTKKVSFDHTAPFNLKVGNTDFDEVCNILNRFKMTDLSSLQVNLKDQPSDSQLSQLNDLTQGRPMDLQVS